jgi:hypothetical protein
MLTVLIVIEQAVSIFAMNRKMRCCGCDSQNFGHCFFESSVDLGEITENGAGGAEISEAG